MGGGQGPEGGVEALLPQEQRRGQEAAEGQEQLGKQEEDGDRQVVAGDAGDLAHPSHEARGGHGLNDRLHRGFRLCLP